MVLLVMNPFVRDYKVFKSEDIAERGRGRDERRDAEGAMDAKTLGNP